MMIRRALKKRDITVFCLDRKAGFSSASIVQRESLKSRLHKAVHEPVVPVEHEIASRKAEKEAKAKFREKVSKQTEALHKYLDDYFSDVKNVIKNKPICAPRHPAVYKYLGTSSNQLKNPYLVSDEVTKLLKKDKLARAVYLVRLAGSNGSVGMNHILQYVSQKKQNSLAVKLYSTMKKWGAKDNDRTFVNLISNDLQKDQVDSKKQKKVQRLLELHEKFAEKVADKKLPASALLINANATLKALGNVGDIDAIRNFYEDISNKDAITYTTALNAASIIDEALEPKVAGFKTLVWKEVEATIDAKALDPDPQLIRSYISARIRSNSDQAARNSIKVFKQYFDLPELRDQAGEESDKTETSPVNTVNAVKKGKFEFKEPELDVWLRYLVRMGKYKQCVEQFEHFEQKGFQLDLAHYKSYVKALTEEGSVDACKKVFEVFKTSEPQPSSQMYADLMKAYINSVDLKEVEVEFIESIKKQCQKAWGKRPHAVLLDAYSYSYAKLFAPENETTVHPRAGVKALNDIALSHHTFAHNLTAGRNVDLCKRAIESTAQLCKSIYSHSAWKKHKFVWINKMGEICDSFAKEHLTGEKIPQKALEEFVFELDAIVRRGQGKKANGSPKQA
uniref:Mitochondrial 15S rRNA processing factor CCM1 n=1 Tax=Blastobotrys adeninivorans TaxID=409370 RepID=A0A060T4G1_BLAAD